MNKAFTIHGIHAQPAPRQVGSNTRGYGDAIVTLTAGGAQWFIRWTLVQDATTSELVVELASWFQSMKRGNTKKWAYRVDAADRDALKAAIVAHWTTLAPSLNFDKVTRDKLTMDVHSAESVVEAAIKALGEAHIKLDKAKAALAAEVKD